MIKCLVTITWILFLGQVVSFGQPLYINEVMSSNQNFIYDEDGDDSDWVELHNSGDSPVNLLGYYISDKSDQLNRWAFPAEIIPAGGHLVVFASGKNRAVAGSELHTNFSIKDEGEALFLSVGCILAHQLPAVALETNKSYGLLPDGGPGSEIFELPTPGAQNTGNQHTGVLSFSASGGFYAGSFYLTLSCTNSNLQILFTTDGSSPTSESGLYIGPLFLDSTLWSLKRIDTLKVSPVEFHHPPTELIPRAIVIRAALFDGGEKVEGSEVTNTYFVKNSGIDHANLPVVSICAEYRDLFNDTTGIMVPGILWDPDNPEWSGNYFQSGDMWERRISFEYYNQNNSGLNQPAGIRIHGGSTRKFPQKGLRIYARAEYGNPDFNIRMFENKDLTEFSRFVLKPFHASWSGAGIEEAVCQGIASNLGVDFLAAKPVVLYLNGEYWGIYYLMERIDDHFLEDNYGVEKDSVDLIANWWGVADEGTCTEFIELYDYIENHTFTDSLDYQFIEAHVDVGNFIDYQIYEIFISNYDWPSNNMKCWRPQHSGAGWRWIFYDGDAALHLTAGDGFEQALSLSDQFWPTNAHTTLFLRKFLENQVFFEQFKNRLVFLLNNTLSDEQTSVFLDNNINKIQSEVPNQIRRFRFPESYSHWTAKTNNMQFFLSGRPCVMKNHFIERFDEQISVTGCLNSIEEPVRWATYPNPANGEFSIAYLSKQKNEAEISIVNQTGQRVLVKNTELQAGINNIRINISNLPDGFYIVCMNDGKDLSSTKLIVLNE
ncbi:MAG: CotH kinase family protein [Lentimicrobium sp.]